MCNSPRITPMDKLLETMVSPVPQKFVFGLTKQIFDREGDQLISKRAATGSDWPSVK